LGLSAITAANGDEGVEMLKKYANQIDAVILDMVMPKKSGKQTFIEMKELRNDLSIIISSGFSRDARVEAMMSLGAKAFIHKPYDLKKLSDALTVALKKQL
jgi:DNA-binding response OmpR family regulator